MRKTLAILALTTGLFGVVGCGGKEKPLLKGIIQAESFYARGGYGGSDRYTTVVEILPAKEKISTFNYEGEARTLDLLYNVGDTVEVEQPSFTGYSHYRILNPLK